MSLKKRKNYPIVLKFLYNQWRFCCWKKRRAENKSCKIKYFLKELVKETVPKDFAAFFGVPGSAQSTWKKEQKKTITYFIT